MGRHAQERACEPEERQGSHPPPRRPPLSSRASKKKEERRGRVAAFVPSAESDALACHFFSFGPAGAASASGVGGAPKALFSRTAG